MGSSIIEARMPFNGPLYGLAQLGLVVGTIPGLPRPILWSLLFPILWISYHLISGTTTGDLPVDVALGSAILTQLMIGLDAMFLTHPDALSNGRETRLKGKKITEQPFKERLRFAFNLYVNPRGIGWTHEHRHLPSRPSPSTPRSEFALTRLFTALACVLAECVAYTINASNPGMTTPGKGLRDAGVFWRALGVLGFATAGAARICALNCVLAASVVALGFSSPDRWPWLFGNVVDGWTIQRFWRRVWHQLLRKSLISSTTFLSSILGFPPLAADSSPLSRFIFLYIAFFIIGLVHIGGEYMLLGRWKWDGAFAFFQLQAVGITLEKMVCWVWSKAQGVDTQAKPTIQSNMEHRPRLNGNGHHANGSSLQWEKSEEEKKQNLPPLWARCIGYVWVASWFIWSLAYMIDPMTTTGMFSDPRVDLRRMFVRVGGKLGNPDGARNVTS